MKSFTPTGIHCHRFLHEHVFSRFNCRFEMEGTENGRSSQYDEIHLGGDDLLVGIESVKHGVFPDLVNFVKGQTPSGKAGFDGILGLIEMVFEQVAHGDEFNVGIGRCAVGDTGPATTASQSDETDADFVGSAFGVNGWDMGEQGSQASGPGGFNEMTT